MTDIRAGLGRIADKIAREGHSVTMEEGGRCFARTRPLALERALSNIIGNACKYAQHAWVSCHASGDAIDIIVDDDGPGIPEAAREDVFKPFYRLEKSRNVKTGGIGLGMAIAQDIVHGHGGEIALETSPRGGLRVLVR